jgi:hypothetical protein
MNESETPTSFVDIKESYVDEKLREFFEKDDRDVNIDNICLFAAKTVEEYNLMAEIKLQGKQKLEAATELAKSVIEKTIAFVAEDKRRVIVKNIYYNMGAIQSTIQFIVDVSNNPNLINAGKWVQNTKQAVQAKKGALKSRFFTCFGKSEKNDEPPKNQEVTETSIKTEEEVPETSVKTEKIDKNAEKARVRKEKEDAERKRREEELQAKLEDLKLTPEERTAKKEEEAKAKKEKEKAKKEEAKAEKEEAKAQKEEAKAKKEEAKAKKEEEKKEKERKEKEARLQAKLEELRLTPEERAAKKREAKEEERRIKEQIKKDKENVELERKAAKLQAEIENLKVKEAEIENLKVKEEQPRVEDLPQ